MPVCSGSLTGGTLGDARRDDFDRAALLGDDRAFAVERVAERIDHAAEQLVADGHAQQAARASDFVAFGDRQVVAEDDDADGVFFEVERQADRAVGELDHLLGHDAREAVDAGDAVADFEHAADFADVDLRRELLDFLLNDRGDFVAIEFHRLNTCMSWISWPKRICPAAFQFDPSPGRSSLVGRFLNGCATNHRTHDRRRER